MDHADRLLRLLRRLARRIGRRGASLLFVGSLAFVLAASLIYAPPEQRASPSYRVLDELAPLWLWATAWAVSGALSWIQAFAKQDRIAFAMSTALWWLYGIAYIIGVVTGANPRGWVGGLIWLAFGAWLSLIATWPEADPPTKQDPATPGDAIITADASGTIRTWNTVAEHLFGWRSSEVVGRASVDIIIPPDLRAAHHHALALARDRSGLSVTGGRVMNTRALHRDGATFPVETTLGLVEAPTGTIFSAVIRRLTEE